LDDEQSRPVEEAVGEPRRGRRGKGVGIVLPATAQRYCVEPGETVFAKIEGGMLPGQDQARRYPAGGKRLGDRGKLDGFGTGADDQPYVGKTQSSP
jgi:hypothetical protein